MPVPCGSVCKTILAQSDGHHDAFFEPLTFDGTAELGCYTALDQLAAETSRMFGRCDSGAASFSPYDHNLAFGQAHDTSSVPVSADKAPYLSELVASS